MSHKNNYDYLIIGSGLSGATFAYEARRRGKRCLVIEKRPHTGGNIYCQDQGGIHVHLYGAHIFHTSDPKIWNYINQFASFNNYINSPLAFYKDKLFNLPFNMNTFYQLWNVKTPEEAKTIIESQKKPFQLDREARNLEEQALALCGKDIYEYLIKGYTEKQWGCAATELPPFIISRIPLRFTFNNNYFNDIYQGIPHGGYNTIIDKMLEGIEVITGCNFCDHKDYFETLADKIVYTGRIDEYFNYCLGTLEYRSLRFETEVKDCENFQGNAVINYTDSAIPYTRVIEHKHFEFGTQPHTVITYEYPSPFQRDSEPYYPINNAKNNRLYEQYNRLAQEQQQVLFCGRLAEYKYYDMDDAIASSLSLVENEFIQTK